MLYRSKRSATPSSSPQNDWPPVRSDDFAPTPTPTPAPPPVPSAPVQQSGIGQLIFRVATARGAIPLEDAQITVWPHNPTPGEEGGGQVVAVLYSDRDGKTDPLALPAPPRSDSLEPSVSGALPFSNYDAEVYLPGYYAPSYTRIPIFDGITSIQSVDLIPLPENGREEGLTPSDTQFFEGENPDL